MVRNVQYLVSQPIKRCGGEGEGGGVWGCVNRVRMNEWARALNLTEHPGSWDCSTYPHIGKKKNWLATLYQNTQFYLTGSFSVFL